MRTAVAFVLGMMASGVVASAVAEEWVDYQTKSQPWEIRLVKVEPGMTDKYLTALKKTYIPQMELGKKSGEVADFHVLVNEYGESSSSPTVIFLTKMKDWAVLAPNKERDLKMEADAEKIMPKSEIDKSMEDYSKYRTVLDSNIYGELDYAK